MSKKEDFVQWNDTLSVGIEEIDEQHKVLVSLLNEMHDAISEQKGSSVVEEILAKLSEYARIHFAVEESLMRILNYPDYETHKGHHDELVQQVLDLQEQVRSGKAAISFQLMHFLKVWLTKHIMVEDQGYSEHFLSAGASSTLKRKSWIERLWQW